uniref:Periotrophin n=1 Tax=Patella vulgata TaxID=6465 RepID=J7QXJ3_PATVU|nr:Periotrophin [Patella vulgata]
MLLISFLILLLSVTVNGMPCTVDCTNMGKLGQGAGTFPDCDDCSKYHFCNGTMIVTKQCETNLFYDMNSGACNFASNAVCGTGYVTVESVCTTNCTDVMVDGIYPYCDSCTKFVTCNIGNVDVQECAENLVFDTNTKACSVPTNATCAIQTPEETSPVTSPVTSPALAECTIDCSNVGSGVFPYCGDCTKKVMCFNGEVMVVPCQQGLYFDIVSKTCSFPADATCGMTSPSTVEDPDEPRPNEECISDCTQMENGDYQSCYGCHMYCTCSNGMMYDKRPCPANTVWDDIQKMCMHISFTCMTA